MKNLPPLSKSTTIDKQWKKYLETGDPKYRPPRLTCILKGKDKGQELPYIRTQYDKGL
jgi:hypothetical protein